MKVALVMLLLLLSVSTSYGETYKYLDEKGVPSFTNDINSIPPRYRKGAVLLEKDHSMEGRVDYPPAAGIDESLLPEKVEKTVSSPVSPDGAAQEPGEIPYMNIVIISSLFLGTLILAFFVNNRVFRMILRTASVASILTLLFYLSTFFVSRHAKSLKRDAAEMAEMMRKKEAEKGRALQEALGDEPLKQKDR